MWEIEWKKEISKLLKDIYSLEAAWSSDSGNMGMQNAPAPDDLLIDFIRSLLAKQAQGVRKQTLEEAIELIGIHTDHDGSYCDTGEDMDWACRSECIEKGIKQIRRAIDNLQHEAGLIDAERKGAE